MKGTNCVVAGTSCWAGVGVVGITSRPVKWRRYAPDVILLCVRWYCRFQLSYRDVEEMTRERGLDVDHVTISDGVKTPVLSSSYHLLNDSPEVTC